MTSKTVLSLSAYHVLLTYCNNEQNTELTTINTVIKQSVKR